MELYDFQKEQIAAIYEAMKEHRNIMVQSPTGSGKTVMFNHIASEQADLGKRVLIIADRKELILQTQNRLWKDNGKHSGVIMSGYDYISHLPIQVASIQTLNRRSYPRDISLIIIDEARASLSESYKKVIQHYENSFILGFDATPIRTNGAGFEQLYTTMIHGRPIKYLEDIGKLVPAKCFINPIDRYQLAKVKVKSTGDYDETDLENFMENSNANADLVEAYQKHANGLKVIIFAINIAHSKKIEKHYQAAGINCKHVDGEMDSTTRDRIFNQFRSGEIMALVNVGLATYGFDEKSIMVVQLARPTRSLSLYLQMAGRGSRISPNKEFYILLDNANCIMDHGRPNAKREWTLTGTKKDKPKPKEARIFRIKFPNGEIKEMAESQIPLGVKGLDMVELKQEYRVHEFEKLIKFAESRQFKRSYAMFKFFEKIDVPSEIEIKYVSQRLGFKTEWVKEMAKNVQEKKPGKNN